MGQQGYLHRITERPLVGRLRVTEYNASWEERFGDKKGKIPTEVRRLLEEDRTDVVYERRHIDHYFCDGGYTLCIVWTTREEVAQQFTTQFKEVDTKKEDSIFRLCFEEDECMYHNDLMRALWGSQQLTLPYQNS